MKQSIKMISSLVVYTAASCGVADKVTPPEHNYNTSSGSSTSSSYNAGGSGGNGNGGDYTGSLSGYGGSAGGEYNGGFGVAGKGGETSSLSGSGGSTGGKGGSSDSTTYLGGFGGNSGSAGGENNGGFGNTGNGGEAASGFSGQAGHGGSAGGSYNNNGGSIAVGGFGGFGGSAGSSNEGGAGNYNGSGGNGGSDASDGGNGGAGGDYGELLGKFTTYSQGGWHNSAASLLPAILSSGEVVIGDKNEDYAAFTMPDAIINFLPATEMPGALQGQYTNPTTTPAGVLAGQTLTLKLNLAISSQVCGSRLEDLIITEGTCENKSVSEMQVLADQALAGMPIELSYSDVNRCVEKINLNFKEGNVDNQYLRLP